MITNRVATANRIAGGYVETPIQPAIVCRPPRQAERTSSTTPVRIQRSAYRSFSLRPRISSNTTSRSSSEAIEAAIEI